MFIFIFYLIHCIYVYSPRALRNSLIPFVRKPFVCSRGRHENLVIAVQKAETQIPVQNNTVYDQIKTKRTGKKPFQASHNNIQCRPEISEPKCARKTRIIRVFVYTHTDIDIHAYAYLLIRVCLISMYELAYCFFYCGKVIVDFNGHCNCSEFCRTEPKI